MDLNSDQGVIRLPNLLTMCLQFGNYATEYERNCL